MHTEAQNLFFLWKYKLENCFFKIIERENNNKKKPLHKQNLNKKHTHTQKKPNQNQTTK